MAPPRPTRIAFFDVDETLITVKSMFRFLQYYLRAIGRSPSGYSSVRNELRGLMVLGASRAEVVRAYYRSYAGRDVDEVAAYGRAWFEWELRCGQLFLPASVHAFLEHRRGGEMTVLVSGSFAACLDPIAEWLGADRVFGARPEVVGGVYTGGLVIAMIGPDKAAAARATMTEHGARPADCHAYGDHASDLPLLLAVGNPVLVGTDPVLVDHAVSGGWRRLPGVDTVLQSADPAAAGSRRSRAVLVRRAAD